MALPAGVQTAAVSFGNGFDLFGAEVPATLKVEAVFATSGDQPAPDRLVWLATGQAMLPIERTLTSVSSDDLVELPAVDQPGWVDQFGNEYRNWHYKATLRYVKDNVSTQTIRTFQVLMGEQTVDLDTMFNTGVSDPVIVLRYPTRSVNGYFPDSFGNITIPTGGTGGEGGADGQDGREVQLRNSGTNIEWRYVGDAAWTNLSTLEALRGPKGNDGASIKGDQGLSAYQVWLAAGNTGSQADYLTAIKGAKGDAGSSIKGDTGASAYQVWLANGNTGTEAQYLASLKGAKGDSVKGDPGATGASGVSATTTTVPVGGSVTPAGAPVGLVIFLAD